MKPSSSAAALRPGRAGKRESVLAKARFDCRREVADTVITGGTVETVTGGAVLEQAGSSGSLEAKRVG